MRIGSWRTWCNVLCVISLLLTWMGCGGGGGGDGDGDDGGGSGSPPFTPTLLADLALASTTENRYELLPNVADRLTYVSEGTRVRAVDLDERAYADSEFPQGFLYCLDPNDDLLGAIAPDSGKIRSFQAYRVGTSPPSGLPTGMAWNPTNETCWITDNYQSGLTSLLSYDPETSGATLFGSTGMGGTLRFYGLAREPTTGFLYSVEVADDLYRFDPGTGAAAHLGATGRNDIQGLSFSAGGTLYGINTVVPPELVTVSTADGSTATVGDLPLGTEIGSLAFCPDGTLWTVDLTLDRLLQLDPNDASVVRAFDTLRVPKTWGEGYLFLAINALTWCPEPTTMAWEEDTETAVEALALAGNGRVLVSSMSRMGSLDQELYREDMPLTFPGDLVGLEDTVYDPATRRAYARDSLRGSLYEVDADTLALLREIDYRDAVLHVSKSTSVQMTIDTSTGRLFAVDEGTLLAIDLSDDSMTRSERVEEIELGGTVVGALANSPDRRLYVAITVPHVGHCILALHLDTFAEEARFCAGLFIQWMALDPVKNRLAVNWRMDQVCCESEIVLLECAGLTRIPYDLTFPQGAVQDVRMAFDTATNTLVLTRPGSVNRLQFYALPD
jgi:DNA-binding beta-propeller fold protein YncE